MADAVRQGVPTGASGSNAAAASGNAAVITLPGVAGKRNAVSFLSWSYDAEPTSGRLTITDDGNTVFQVDITAAGPGFFSFPTPLLGTLSKAVVITLADGSVNGKVNAITWQE